MSKTVGGPSLPVKIITEIDLEEGGGNYALTSKTVRLAELVEGGEVVGGPVKPVYVVTDSEIEEKGYRVIGGPKLRISDSTLTEDRELEGGGVLLVYLTGTSVYQESEPSGGSVEEGQVIGGGLGSIKKCDNKSSWVIEETVNGIDVRFSFSALGGTGGKVKVRGKSSKKDKYTIQVWNGSSWETVSEENILTVENTYTVILDPEHTVNNQVEIRILKTSGAKERLYLSCATLLTDVTYSYLLLETGDFLLLESGDKLAF